MIKKSAPKKKVKDEEASKEFLRLLGQAVAKGEDIDGLLANVMLSGPLNEIISDSLEEYGKYTIEERAIPALDGLKPSQRRILWAMYDVLGSRQAKGYFKCADAEGTTMKFHPHGGAYSTLVKMVEGHPCPLIIGQGNFGSFSKTYSPPAAPRYTECKLSNFTEQMFFNQRFLKVMDMVPSYDGKRDEPVNLPTMLPMILATGADGIAVGTKTDLPSFTIESLYEAAKLALSLHDAEKKYYVPPKKLARILKFSSAYGGHLAGGQSAVIEQLMKTGIASINWECEYKVDQKTVNVYGLPPGWVYDTVIEKIRNHPAVSEVVNFTSKKGIRIQVSFKRMTEDDHLDAVDSIVKMLKSTKHYRCNITIRKRVDDPLVPTHTSEFMKLSISKILQKWCFQRVNFEKRALKLEFDELQEKIAYQNLLLLASDHLDIIFAILKMKKVDKVQELMKKLKITEEQSKTIWQIQVGRLDRLSREEILGKIKELTKRKKEVQALYKKPAFSSIAHMETFKKELTSPIAYEYES